MKITILTDNPNSWIVPYIEELKKKISNHIVTHVYNINDVTGGDIMLILSCEKLLTSKNLSFHKSNVVVHPSKLPQGKGWSPLAWQILEGCNNIPVSLFEAVEGLDAGNVYIVDYIKLEGHELNEEIKQKQWELTIKMVINYIDNFETMIGIAQSGKETFYQRRRQKENELDTNSTILELFNLLRVVDNERYPAYFYQNNKKYIIKIYKEEEF